jgi:hypothetical protein
MLPFHIAALAMSVGMAGKSNARQSAMRQMAGT